jgi:alpha-ketoglutarate-dependent taurine dioxygenase
MNGQSDLETLKHQGYLIKENVNFNNTDEFNDYCSSIGPIWSPEVHKIHTETVDIGNVIQWSSKTRFKQMSIPWHCDNPWHSHYKFPLRVLYGVNIPDSNDGKLWICNMVSWFDKLSEERKEYFRNLKVLMQDYKRGCSPYWTSFVKKHPLTNKESLNWGSMSVNSNAFGVRTDENFVHRNAYMIVIEDENRVKITDEQIGEWWNEMTSDNLICHKWKKNDLVVLDNWSTAHYRERINNNEERLLWRRTIGQSWHLITPVQQHSI